MLCRFSAITEISPSSSVPDQVVLDIHKLALTSTGHGFSYNGVSYCSYGPQARRPLSDFDAFPRIILGGPLGIISFGLAALQLCITSKLFIN